MSSFIHSIFGLFIGLIFWKVSEGKFTRYHTFLLGLCCWYGPDWAWALRPLWKPLEEIHTYWGFTIFSIPLSLLYYLFLCRQTIRKKELEFQFTYFNVFCLVFAGGMFHFWFDHSYDAKYMIDFIFSTGNIAAGEGWYWQTNILVIFLIVFITTLIWSLKYELKYTNLVIFLGTIVYFTFLVIWGYYFVANETDLGTQIFVFTHVLGPLYLIYLSYYKVPGRVYPKNLKFILY